MTGVTAAAKPPPATRTEEIEAQFAAAAETARALVAGLDAATLARPPAPDRWSIAACLEHLNLTGSIYLAALDPALERAAAAPPGAAGRVRLGLVGRLIGWAMEPPPRLRVRTPVRFRPRQEGEPMAVVDRFLAMQQELIACCRRAAGVDAVRTRLVSPVEGRLRINLGVALYMVAAHQRRHLWQAGRVREALERSGAAVARDARRQSSPASASVSR